MLISHLKLENFRCFSKLELSEIHPSSNAVIASNGSGKSNLLEALFFLSTGSSSRTSKSAECIKWGEDFARVESSVNGTTLAVFIEKNKKVFLVNGKTVPLKSFLGHLPLVFFQPTDLNLLIGSPQLRRTFLDRLITQTDFEYLYSMTNYRKLLSHRNIMLREKSNDHEYMLLIEEKMAVFIEYIYRKRVAVIMRLNEFLATKNLEVVYHPSPKSLSEESDEGIAEIMREKFRELREKERTVGFTLIGPQREDIKLILLDGSHPDGRIDLGDYGSRGQQRMGIISLKIAESNVIEHFTQRKPLFSLDDVFSELDEDNGNLLLENMFKSQYIVTAASNNVITADFPQDSRVITEEILRESY